MADYLKAVITGRNLPPALQAQAADSRWYLQYDPTRPRWVARPEQLPNTDLTAVFEREDQPVAVPTVVIVPTAVFVLPSPPTLVPFPIPTVLPGPMPGAPVDLTATPVSTQPTPSLTVTVNPAPPVIDGTEPGGADVGQDIIIRGKNFGAQSGYVFFTAKLTTAQVWSDTNIIVTIPQGATDGVIRIRRADGVFSNSVGFSPHLTPTPLPSDTPTPQVSPSLTLTPSLTPTPPAPVINDLSPYFGPPNSAFIISGAIFGTVTGQVLMGSSFAPVETNGWSDSSIAARVPSDQNPGVARVFVRRPDGLLNVSPRCFVVQPAPTTTPSAPTATPPPGVPPTATSLPQPTPAPVTAC
jgi:hypothetical protein